MRNDLNILMNTTHLLRQQHGLYCRPVRDNGGTGDPVLLVWSAAHRGEADLENPDHRIRLSDNGHWWIDHESGLHLMTVKEGPVKLALAVANMIKSKGGE